MRVASSQLYDPTNWCRDTSCNVLSDGYNERTLLESMYSELSALQGAFFTSGARLATFPPLDKPQFRPFHPQTMLKPPH